MATHDIIMAAGGSAATTAATYVEDVFSTYVYNGTGASQTITNGIDLSTNGGMVWLKGRSGATDHALYDTARGATYDLVTNSTAAATTQSTGLTAFGTTGFTIGALAKLNTSAATYTSFAFRKQAKFFDVVTYTGTGSATTIAHSLGATPGMIIVKRTDATQAWVVYHNAIGNTGSLQLASTSAATTSSTTWNNTSPTSTQFTVGTNAASNASGGTYVAYLFADSNSGGFGASGTDSVVACGSYAGSSGSVSVNLGWEPQYVLVKCANAAVGWFVVDVMRGASNTSCFSLSPNSSSAEADEAGPVIIPTATGFTVTNASGSFNSSGYNWIYLAIRRGPMKTPTDATKVFATVTDSSLQTNDIHTAGFPVDLDIGMYRAGGAYSHLIFDRLRGGQYSVSSSTAAEGGYPLGWDIQTGVKYGSASNENFVSQLFRRAPGFFDVVCYTGTGNKQTVSHNLGVVPEIIITKKRSGADEWVVYDKFAGSSGFPFMNLNRNEGRDGNYTGSWVVFGNTTPTSSAFYWNDNNNSLGDTGLTYVAYLFASCPGVSKVGSYTGNGSSQTINCGFASGARFVLIKRTDSTGSWWVFDSARGIVSAADPALQLNSTAAETTSADAIDPDSTGFIVNQETTCNLNVSSATYIYLAIA